ncbi:hypothetical protein CC80DRAFT_508750 [Byssothecium circinans]|uniref:Uncharacterized protein n=1 Tax=Byssothecium circinans TaxID=147558 RepID=A0A6A5TIT5_9PLEO|nr:hypothetical protein CC80DRAFT_508750 [Byssothecium circinans]
MDPITLLDSFEIAKLPGARYVTTTRAQKKKIAATPPKPSGNAVKRFPIPKYLIKRDVDEYIRDADAALARLRASNLDVKKGNMSAVTKTQIINEADIVPLIDKYLVTPVKAAIDGLYEEDFIVSSEISLDHARVDSALRIDRGSGNYQNIVLIELKNRTLLSPEVITNALCEESDPKMHFLTTRDHAIYFIKQAAFYSKTYNTNFAVLCDYDTLVLVKFFDLNKNNRPQKAHVTVVRKFFRKALLGFLIEASNGAELRKRVIKVDVEEGKEWYGEDDTILYPSRPIVFITLAIILSILFFFFKSLE